MNSVYFLKLAKDPGCGLCNQLYALCGCIDHQIQTQQHKIIIVDSFLKEINTNKRCPLGDILDLSYINSAFLLPQFNMLVLDQSNLRIQLEHIFWVIQHKTTREITNVHVKDEVLSLFFKDQTTLQIPKEYSIPLFDHDMLDFHIVLRFNEYPIKYSFKVNETGRSLANDIDMPLILTHRFQPSPRLYLGHSQFPERFAEISKQLRFQSRFHTQHDLLFNTFTFTLVQPKSKINVLHLRMENDAMQAFSKQNHVSLDLFKTKVGEKYIHMIQTYLNPQDVTIVIANDFDNQVIAFLHQHHYRFVCSPKLYQERELNAIQDMLYFKECNHVFVGVYESSFSFSFLFKLFSKTDTDPTCILFQMNALNQPEKVYNKNSPFFQIQNYL